MAAINWLNEFNYKIWKYWIKWNKLKMAWNWWLEKDYNPKVIKEKAIREAWGYVGVIFMGILESILRICQYQFWHE